ncbi:hypothetical protein BL253_36375 [Pseudofrankia asymbiotica]|uniref:Amidohydrolase-related domain-containing protein n=1 Tax=Pseudofrankia asymbiotica TaxID=1834516 RepID=A0A1V2HZE7_9ACTN|nr:hypothetical protein BL253_36375 [Pseudofrankia asymbiotica]
MACAVRGAQETQLAWAARTPAQRAAVLLAIAASIRASEAELSALESAETGKIAPEREVEASAEYFSYYGAVVRAVAGESLDLGSGSMAFTRRQPYGVIGVIGVITPWNGLLNQACRDVAPAFEMFRRNIYGTFWFEHAGSNLLLDYLGDENIMWETAFPHPTCLYPSPVERSAAALKDVPRESLRKIMQDNAAKLYNLPLGNA